MANVERDNNMMNEEQESSQSNSSNGSGATPQQNQSSFQLKSSILRHPATFGSGAGAGGGLFGSGSTALAAGGGGFNLKPSVLKPSHFGGSAFQNNSSGGSNSFGSNPFLKTQQSEEDPVSEASGHPAETSSDGTAKTEKEDGGGSDPLTALNRSTLPKSNLFANVKSISENKGFVFGQNVHERVTGGETMDVSATPTAGLSFSSAVATTTTTATNNSNDSSSSNSTTPASTVATAGSTGNNGDKPESTGGAADESLEEAARRYEESRGALKRKFDEVETLTGEEDERNVAELNCKLFAFAKSNWEERGHGTLRLNDNDNGSKESRVVFRQAGNLRVLINTKVWSGMIAEHSSQKSLRLTAMDNNGQVKVFLVMSRPDVIGKLHKELTKRIETAKEMIAATGEDDDSKENNDENVSSAAAAKPSEDDDHAAALATPPVVVVVEKDGAGDDEPPSAKKRLSAAASP